MKTILNESLNQCPAPAFRNFLTYRKIRLEADETLCKFTGWELFPGGRVSPWWAIENPIAGVDPGIDAVLKDARKSGKPLIEFIREAYAVMFEWNTLAAPQSGLVRMQRIRLLRPVYAFHGMTSPVLGKRPPLAYPLHDQRKFIGGALQVFIPNLTSEHVVGTGLNLLPDFVTT